MTRGVVPTSEIFQNALVKSAMVAPPHDLDCCLDRAALLTQEGIWANLNSCGVPVLPRCQRPDHQRDFRIHAPGATGIHRRRELPAIHCVFHCSVEYGVPARCFRTDDIADGINPDFYTDCYRTALYVWPCFARN